MSGRPILVFDGDCAFCTRSALAAKRRLRLNHVEPWQSLDLQSLGLTEEQCARAVQWVEPDGSVMSGEHAVIGALRGAGGAWSVAGRAMDLPGLRQVTGMTYRLVARNRHKMPGTLSINEGS